MSRTKRKTPCRVCGAGIGVACKGHHRVRGIGWRKDCTCSGGSQTGQLVAVGIPMPPGVDRQTYRMTLYPGPVCLRCNRPWKELPT